MTLGEKIKKARRANRITQEGLAKNKITRNMISRIENGLANPSLETIRYIANELSLPVSYFLSENDDLLFYEKAEKINTIYRAYQAKEYEYCIKKIKSLSGIDNELAFLLCASSFELGREKLSGGSLSAALKCFKEAEKYSEITAINTSYINATLPLYVAIATNVRAPLLEFDKKDYDNGLHKIFDYELYKYVTQDFDYDFKNPLISHHVNAKKKIKERDYQTAVKILSEAEDMAKNTGYNAFVMFGIYTDLEHCYKELFNFEKAYLYSTKRISMLEGFKS